MMNANEAEAEASPCANNLSSLCNRQGVVQQFGTLGLEPEAERPAVSPLITSSPVAAAGVGIKRRCEMCQRKVGMLGFNCRCGHMFCGSHRYPEEHSCSFDYRQSGRLALAAQLPLIRADKLQRF